MILARFWSYLTKKAIYGIAKDVSLDLDMAVIVEISEDCGLSKRLSQLGKSSSSIRS